MKLRFIALTAAILGATPTSAAPRAWVATHQTAILAEYRQLLAIPNVATSIPDIRRNADHIMVMMANRGLSPRLLEGDAVDVPPAIYGEWRVPGAKRTLVFYAHYDGQPVDPRSGSTPPFEPDAGSDRLGAAAGRSARRRPARSTGVADLRPRRRRRQGADRRHPGRARRARGRRRAPAVNLKLFLEGEEEAGSPHLGDSCAAHATCSPPTPG